MVLYIPHFVGLYIWGMPNMGSKYLNQTMNIWSPPICSSIACLLSAKLTGPSVMDFQGSWWQQVDSSLPFLCFPIQNVLCFPWGLYGPSTWRDLYSYREKNRNGERYSIIFSYFPYLFPSFYFLFTSPSQDRRHNKKEHNKKELNVILHVKVWETDTTAART